VRSAFAAAGPPDLLRSRGLRESLAALREHLAAHFQQEEAGGFLEESITRMPRLSAAMKAVLADHPRLLAELDLLVGLVGTAEVSTAQWDRAAHDYEQFARHLVAHERTENTVVQQGYNEDLGLVD
jgi:hypothetical protein